MNKRVVSRFIVRLTCSTTLLFAFALFAADKPSSAPASGPAATSDLQPAKQSSAKPVQAQAGPAPSVASEPQQAKQSSGKFAQAQTGPASAVTSEPKSSDQPQTNAAQTQPVPVSSQAGVSESQSAEQPSAKSGPVQLAPATETTQGSAMDFPILRAAGGLAVVLSLILIGFLVARKVAPQYFNRRTAEKTIKMIESLSMGEKRSIALIQLGNKRYLVGNTPQQITLISALEDSLSLVSGAEKSPSPESASKVPANPFRRLYETEKVSGGSKPGKEKTIPPDIRAKMRQLREALEG